MRVAVLVSGSGTNLQALIDARNDLGATLAVVVSNRADAPALERARAANLDAISLPHKDFDTRAAFDRALRELLQARGIELVVLAGFMRVLTAEFLDAFVDRVINVHPALLPAFPGIDAQRQALDYGVKVSGCTVHFVDAGVDTGPIIAQAVVPVLDDDDLPKLRARILAEEHRLLPRVVRDLAAGRVRREGRKVVTLDH